MARAAQFDTIGFDADDTLWKSEDYFTVAEQFFVAKVGPYAPAGIDVLDRAARHRARQRAGVGLRRQGLRALDGSGRHHRHRRSRSVVGDRRARRSRPRDAHAPGRIARRRARDAGRGRKRPPARARSRRATSCTRLRKVRTSGYRAPLRAHPGRAREGRRHLPRPARRVGHRPAALPDGRQLGQVRHPPDSRAGRAGRARPVPRDLGARAGARARRRVRRADVDPRAGRLAATDS